MKLASRNLKKLLERCTKKCIDLLIYIGQFQDAGGVIKGIKARAAASAIGVSRGHVYKLMNELAKQSIISINHFGEYGYFDVQIIDNVLATEEDRSKGGYLNLNIRFIHSLEFKKMTKSEKVIILTLLTTKPYGGIIRRSRRALMELTGKSLRSVRKFIDTIAKAVGVQILYEDGVYTFTFTERMKEDRRGAINEAEAWIKHLIYYRQRKAKASSPLKNIRDAVKVFKYFKIGCAETIIKIADKCLADNKEINQKYINILAQPYAKNR